MVMESRTTGCVRETCMPGGYGEQVSRLSEQVVCPMVMESRTTGCVRAKCVPDGYVEQNSRLSSKYVCPRVPKYALGEQ